MPWEFVAAGVAYHVVIAAVCVSIARRWRQRAATIPSRGVATAVLRDVALLGAAAAALAVPAASFAADPFFAWVRLVCQVLFGESVVLAGTLALLLGRRRGAAGAAAPAAIVALLLAGYWEAYHRGPRDLQVRELELALDDSPAGAGLALRLLHMSDIQTDAVGPHERAAISLGMARRPDLIVLTGDYLHRRVAPLRPDAELRMRQLLSRLRAPYGVYAVPGDADRGCALFDELIIPCLQDEVAGVALAGGRSLALIGLSLRSSRARDPARLAPLLARVSGADFRIVLGHSPDFVAALRPEFGVDLALAGHTHGGQVVLPGFGPLLTLSRLPRRYAGGLHDFRGVPLHVSRGVGLERGSAPAIRFFCPPELSVLEVRYAPRSRPAGALPAGG